MFDGDPRAAFAILKVFSGEIAVEHYRIPYPVGAVITGLKQDRLPDIYAKMCRLGGETELIETIYMGPKFSKIS